MTGTHTTHEFKTHEYILNSFLSQSVNQFISYQSFGSKDVGLESDLIFSECFEAVWSWGFEGVTVVIIRVLGSDGIMGRKTKSWIKSFQVKVLEGWR